MEKIVQLRKSIKDLDVFELHCLKSELHVLYVTANSQLDAIRAQIHGNINREFKDK